MTSRIGWSAEEIPRHRAKQLWTSNPEASLFQEGERIFSAIYWMFISSIQFSQLVMSDSLWPHGLQLARLPCPSPTPEVYSNSCPLSRWCHPTISSSVVPFSSCLQSFPASELFFPRNQFFEWGGQRIGVSASASVLPMNIQDWSPLGWTGGISKQSKGLSRVFSNTTFQKHQFWIQFSSLQSLSHVWLYATPWIAAYQASLSITNSRSLLKLMSIESVMPSSHFILCRPLLLLPPIPPSLRIFFQWVSSSHQVAKILEFQLQHQSFQWTPRIDLL